MHHEKRHSMAGRAFVLILAVVIAVNVSAQTPDLWGDLEPGQYGVGFKTFEQYDYSRTFRPEKDYFGAPMEGESARPIQVCYWYPAEQSESALRMVYGEYAFPYPEDATFFELLTALQDRDLGTVMFFMGNNRAAAQRAMDLGLMAVRDAVAVEGSFPLIIYHGGRMSGYQQNAVMGEYLASHGFVVATTHSLGMQTTAPTETATDFEAATRDKELVASLMRGRANVNADQVGLLGYGFGASTAMNHQMRNKSIDAVVTLNARFLTTDGAEFLSQSPFYAPLEMLVPWLQFYAETEQMPAELRLLDSLKYSDRLSIKMNSMQPLEFSSTSLLAALITPDSTRPLEQINSNYGTVCQYVHKFFDAHLNGNDASLTWIQNPPEKNGLSADQLALSAKPASEAPPTQVQFVSIIQNQGVEHAGEICKQFGLDQPENPIMPNAQFTGLGYQFLQRGDATSAVEIFKWGVTAYPGSANAWDSYGEACVANGELELALANYKKSQELIPTDTTLMANFAETLVTSAAAGIERIKQMMAERGDGK